VAKPSGDHNPLGGFVFRVRPMTQDRFTKFVFSTIVIVVAIYWVWFMFAHADRIFRHRPANQNLSDIELKAKTK
jgi:RsiW-degrading membrane proteinase PrsW (M82 family)